nr:hypothetical protein [Halomonas sp. YLGW01]
MRATHSIRSIATHLGRAPCTVHRAPCTERRVARNRTPHGQPHQGLRCQPGGLSSSFDATAATSASQAAP